MSGFELGKENLMNNKIELRSTNMNDKTELTSTNLGCKAVVLGTNWGLYVPQRVSLVSRLQNMSISS